MAAELIELKIACEEWLNAENGQRNNLIKDFSANWDQFLLKINFWPSVVDIFNKKL